MSVAASSKVFAMSKQELVRFMHPNNGCTVKYKYPEFTVKHFDESDDDSSSSTSSESSERYRKMIAAEFAHAEDLAEPPREDQLSVTSSIKEPAFLRNIEIDSNGNLNVITRAFTVQIKRPKKLVSTDSI